MRGEILDNLKIKLLVLIRIHNEEQLQPNEVAHNSICMQYNVSLP